jgi:acyl-CoA dehydrogenase
MTTAAVKSPDLTELVDVLHKVGREIIGPAAGDVDRAARFPREAIDALKELGLLSAYVPRDLGGMGLTIAEIARICEVLGRYCGSTAMVFAMHQIQVACLVQHGRRSPYFEGYLRDLVAHQHLIASATSEIGVGGDVRQSFCAVEVAGDRFTVVKRAPVISYGEAATHILLTCRRAADAPPNDQVLVLVAKPDCGLSPFTTWDTLGFRGTCSTGFVLTAEGQASQIMPVPFADILNQTMHPVSHIVWSSLWSGIAHDAVRHARGAVRAEARKHPDVPPISAIRLAEVDAVLQTMRSTLDGVVAAYGRLLQSANPEAFRDFGFIIRVNNLKLTASELVVDIVGKALLIVGISAYRNDSASSLGRHLRDAYGASLMVNNDRIMNHNATMLLAHRER